MLIRKLNDCPEIIAADKTILRELLHPDRDYPFTARYSLAHALIPTGNSSIKHILKSSEVYYILKGNGIMHIDEDFSPVEKGDSFEIPPNSVQWLENKGDCDLEFLCLVNPAWKKEDESIKID